MVNILKSPCKSAQKIILKSLVFVLVFVIVPAASACELPQWQAVYTIAKYSTSVARLTMSLQTKDNTAQYRLHSKAVGLLATFSSEELTETSELKQAGNKSWQLIKFSQQRIKDTQRQQHFTVQQTDAEFIAEGVAESKPFKLSVPAPAWDRSSVQLALTCDLLATDKPRQAYDYNIIDNGQLLTYHFEYLGTDNTRITDKQFDTYIFERISGDRSTKFWLAPTLQFMPVRMEQYKQDKLHLSMTLDIPAAEKS